MLFSTIVVSCVRLSAVAMYATSTNPMYDNLMSGVYSVLEINVGIICVSMPAFPRIFAVLLPQCFVSTKSDSKPKFSDNDMPNSLYPSKPFRRKKSTRNSSLFDTTIMKTVDMDAESRPRDDEVNLVEIQKREAKTTARSLGASTTDSEEPHEPRSFYRT